MSFVKICGIAKIEDAQAACAAGADAVGFVLAAGSPRQVSGIAARAIAAELPRHVLTAAVFVETPATGFAAALRECGLNVLQLHGVRSAAEVADLARSHRLWRAIGMAPDADAESLESAVDAMRPLAACVDAFLLDTAVAGMAGGTGTTFHWRAARRLAARLPASVRLIVAGGLHPSNVTEAILQSGAWGVDVSSGVESAPGRKDPAKIRDFIDAARAAFARMEREEKPEMVR